MGLRLAAGKQLHITEVASLAQLAKLNGRANGTSIIGHVRAISVPAVSYEQSEFREELVDITIGYVPEGQLP